MFFNILQVVNDSPDQRTEHPQAVTVGARLVLSDDQNFALIEILKCLEKLGGVVTGLEEDHPECRLGRSLDHKVYAICKDSS